MRNGSCKRSISLLEQCELWRLKVQNNTSWSQKKLVTKASQFQTQLSNSAVTFSMVTVEP